MSMDWTKLADRLITGLAFIVLCLVAFNAISQTVTFEDGTVVELLDDERLYISTETLYQITEAEPFAAELEPFSKPWCEAYLAASQPLTFESIDTRRRCERIVESEL